MTNEQRKKLREELINTKPFSLDEKYIFISYSHKNQESVWRDVIELKKRKINCWIDCECIDGWTYDSQQDWSDQAKQAMEKAEAVLLYISEQAFSSKGFAKECCYLYNKLSSKPFFKFFIDFESTLDNDKMIDIIDQLERYEDKKSDFTNRKVAFTHITGCDKEENYYIHYRTNHSHLDNSDFDNSIRKNFKSYKVDSIFISKKGIRTENSFVGREKELKEIKEKLDTNNVLVVYGEGGIGKTAIINQYLKQNASNYSDIYFNSVDSVKNYVESIPFYETANRGNDDNKYDYNLRVIQRLPENVVFVLDNFDKDIEKDENIRDLIDNSKCKFIITSRNKPEHLNSLEIKPLEKEDLLILVKKVFPKIYKLNDIKWVEVNELLYELFERLSYNTIAIILAATTMKNNEWSIDELNKNLFSGDTIAEYKGESIIIYLSKLFNLIDLDKDEILTLYTLGMFKYPGITRKNIVDIHKFKNLKHINKLIGLKIIHTTDEGTLYLHNLIIELIYENYKVPINKINKIIKYTLKNKLEKITNTYILEQVSKKYKILKILYGKNMYRLLYKSSYLNYEYQKTVEFCDKYINKVDKYDSVILTLIMVVLYFILFKNNSFIGVIMVVSLVMILDFIDNKVKNYLLFETTLIKVRAYKNLNNLSEVENQKLSCLNNNQKIAFLSEVVKAYLFQKIYKSAIKPCHEILELLNNQRNSNLLKKIETLFILAKCYIKNDEFEMAEIYFKKAYEGCEKKYTDYQPNLSFTQQKLYVYWYNILACIEKKYYNENTDVTNIISLNIEYGELFFYGKDRKTSLIYLLKAEKLLKDLFGDNIKVLEYIELFKYISYNYYFLEDYDRAFEYIVYYLKMLQYNEIREGVWMYLIEYMHAAECAMHLDKYEDAIYYYSKALDLFEDKNAPNFYNSKCNNEMAYALLKIGEYQEALEYINHAINIFAEYYDNCFLRGNITDFNDFLVRMLKTKEEINLKNGIKDDEYIIKLSGLMYHYIGYSFEHGINDQKLSYETAFEYYRNSFVLDYKLACTSLVKLFIDKMKSSTVLQDLLDILCKAVDRDDVLARCYLGIFYCTGFGIEKNLEKGEKYLLSAASTGNMIAQCELGKLYLSDKKRIKEAISWLEKSVAQNYPPAGLELGRYYKHKKGLLRKHKKAFYIFEKFIDYNNAEILYELALYYLKGIMFYVRKDVTYAKYLLKRAAKLGYDKANELLDELDGEK